MTSMQKPLTNPFIDLFAGAGGLSLGLEQAGFQPVFVNASGTVYEPVAAEDSWEKTVNFLKIQLD